MSTFLERHSQNAILASIVASVVAIIVAIGSVAFTVHSNKVAQDRQARLEQIAKFDQSTQQIIDAAQSFIYAVNDNKGLDPARSKLKTIVASEIHQTDDISRFFDPRAQKIAESYQTVLEELSDVSQHTSNVTEMRLWAETFGKVLDTKSVLSTELYSQLGIKKAPRG
jgi:oligoendopeptidase F